MIFLRVIALLALLPGISAGEEGLPVSPAGAPAVTAAEVTAAEVTAAPPVAGQPDGAEATEAAAPAPPPKPQVDWSQVKNPVAADAASVARGQALYAGKGMCSICHGEKGDGFGPVRGQFSPFPNALIDPAWHQRFSDGQLMGVLTEGKLGTGMVPFIPDFLTEDEGWDIVNFIRTLNGHTTEAYEKHQVELRKEEERKQEALKKEAF
ncbi:MAG: c-type cytochrome [Nitrospirae bacterium]|nr:c-type cytochrome [Nitrospirota bacterium]